MKTDTITSDVAKIIAISDLHFDVLDPEIQYTILTNQFTNVIAPLSFDLITINGDIFEHKTMSNSKAVYYALKFIDDLVCQCRNKQASLILLAGTREHDADQLQLFFGYMTDPTVDVRIVTSVQFLYVKGLKFLCIPELYGKGHEYYEQFLYDDYYDIALVHGTFINSIYGSNKATLDCDRAPIFNMNHFGFCRGFILSGHVHNPGCFEGYYYYSGSPLRWKFGEEQSKGFLVALYNRKSYEHYVELVPIESFKYIAINLDEMLSKDPKDVIAFANKMKAEQHIDHIRLDFTNIDSESLRANFNIVKEYYKNKRGYHIKADIAKVALQANQETLAQLEQYSYILDNALSDEEKFIRYINDNMGYQFITIDKLTALLGEMV